VAIAGWPAHGAEGSAAEQPSVIRLGFANIGVGNRLYSGGSTVAVAHARGLLEKEFAGAGIKVEWSFFKGAGPAVNEALANGQLDFAAQGDLPSIVGRAGGLKTRVLLATNVRQHTYMAVPTGSPIRTLADLKGHTVADFRGTNAELAVAKILDGAGLSERDIKTVNLDQAGLKAALATGRVEAGFGNYDLLELRDQGLIEVRYSSAGQSVEISKQSSLLVTEEFASRYPEIVDRVVRVVAEAARWASDDANRATLFDLWSKNGVPAKYYAEDYQGDLRVRLSPRLDDFIVERYRDGAARALRFGLIRTPVDVDGWFDRGPLDRALLALGLQHYWPDYDAAGEPKAAAEAVGPGATTRTTAERSSSTRQGE
jgi:sulfonate transport system substrate-binding protein